MAIFDYFCRKRQCWKSKINIACLTQLTALTFQRPVRKNGVRELLGHYYPHIRDKPIWDSLARPRIRRKHIGSLLLMEHRLWEYEIAAAFVFHILFAEFEGFRQSNFDGLTGMSSAWAPWGTVIPQGCPRHHWRSMARKEAPMYVAGKGRCYQIVWGRRSSVDHYISVRILGFLNSWKAIESCCRAGALKRRSNVTRPSAFSKQKGRRFGQRTKDSGFFSESLNPFALAMLKSSNFGLCRRKSTISQSATEVFRERCLSWDKCFWEFPTLMLRLISRESRESGGSFANIIGFQGAAVVWTYLLSLYR